MTRLSKLFLLLILSSCSYRTAEPSGKKTELVFSDLSGVWDEAIPLGNGMVGNLVWQKGERLRFSLDRADLWDLRPMQNIDFNQWKFRDVYEHWKNDSYDEVQQAFDVPYDQLAAPSRIPAGALEFETAPLGTVRSVSLDVEHATCTVTWTGGARLTTFVHAEKPVGWYRFENIEKPVNVYLVPPSYHKQNRTGTDDQAKHDLYRLGYPQGDIEAGDHTLTYNQEGWGGFSYQIHTAWKEDDQSLTGCWSVSSSGREPDTAIDAKAVVLADRKNGWSASRKEHLAWWAEYWHRSVVRIPDTLLQRQYDLEMYKFGSAARAGGPPISLQSVWTADNGKLPPWKGDYHHDLNTQLSYWPSYTGNHLDLEAGFLNWLWDLRPVFRRFTQAYFGVDGLNVPGVTTLEGEPMGGWIQYSLGQGTSAWLGHHFYMHWRFSMDREFLRERAYPWIRDVALFFNKMAVRSEDGKRKLLMSSSPEIYNNSREAWFHETTNFDLALIRWTYEKAAELARELNLDEEAKKWSRILSEWPDLAIDPETGFMFAPGFPYNESHRHFSHLLAFHPLGLVDYSQGSAQQEIINKSLRNLESVGSANWTGYSFSWLGNLYARAFEGENAVQALSLFARCFCLKNSFHVNGDQCRKGYSNFTYRPFTLEGNFAFASAIQEMLIQSHTGTVKLFPAIPADWKEVSFERLRTRGAFLVSARQEGGRVTEVKIIAEEGGNIRLEDPFQGKPFRCKKEYIKEGDTLILKLNKGESCVLHARG